MKYYTEPSREIPVVAETEVLVVGGGHRRFRRRPARSTHGTKNDADRAIRRGRRCSNHGHYESLDTADRTAAALKSCAKRHATVKRSRSSIRKNCVF